MLVKHLHQSVTLVNGFLQGAGRRSNVVVTEVPYCKESITPDNVYVLDTGLKVWQVSPNSSWFMQSLLICYLSHTYTQTQTYIDIHLNGWIQDY